MTIDILKKGFPNFYKEKGEIIAVIPPFLSL
jgi:hypothetical protein